MPEALATTKRKFTKLLDSFSNIAATPPSSTADTSKTTKTPSIRPPSILPPGDERAAKRIKSTSSLSAATFASSIRSNRSITSITSLTRKLPASSQTPQTASSVEPQQPPNFSPWSHETFLQRLKTFSSVSTWHIKPDELSEVEWAKRGWVCVNVNTVGCRGGCERRIVVTLDSDKPAQDTEAEEEHEEDVDAEEALEKALVERYQKLIIDGHAENCLWRKAGCKNDIYRLTLVRPAVWQPELRARYHSLLKVQASIKDISIKTLDTSSDSKSLSAERLLQDLPAFVLGASEVETDAEPSESLKARALAIAMHGWRGSSESRNDLLNCDACFQRIGLWMYQPDYQQRRSGTSTNKTKEPGPWGYVSPPSQEPPQARPNNEQDEDDNEERASIDLVEMHRSHCPYRNPDTQLASGTLAGFNACEILQRVVSTYAREQRRRKNDQKQQEARAARDPAEVANGEEGEDESVDVPQLPRAEIQRLDKERESKLRRLKRVFTMKRRAPSAKT